ncbi:hypothetical protein [Novosphingobium sp. P6W]|uniref:hypothetical protein n=1 Tax=Novosphingobium sp. P6W TaxID=1609758 RepID=UPI0005C2E2C9|nr:hypothetical protein [Novosphingobium sp. P6W]AXB78696.1 hypothetical protein TQ38_018990 [Novosphingobium sp. P6W]KIS31717.1 hypothetical protein TQ38_14875 [Novosphingobium sp. P6W]
MFSFGEQGRLKAPVPRVALEHGLEQLISLAQLRKVRRSRLHLWRKPAGKAGKVATPLPKKAIMIDFFIVKMS